MAGAAPARKRRPGTDATVREILIDSERTGDISHRAPQHPLSVRLPFRDKAAGPAGRERAKNLLWAAGKLADYAMSLGLDLVPETVFHPSVVERFARCAPGLSGAS